ncbi:unnamed protein product [Strongylus vulgaris]|uniref:Uncharacterized protein n=1 Tax=Strongylus vulgaris TaxID=40348 RepID=A0A3P7IS71_STRVU|nr:unnamed protein product [Strongylus vulgaris]
MLSQSPNLIRNRNLRLSMMITRKSLKKLKKKSRNRITKITKWKNTRSFSYQKRMMKVQSWKSKL